MSEGDVAEPEEPQPAEDPENPEEPEEYRDALRHPKLTDGFKLATASPTLIVEEVGPDGPRDVTYNVLIGSTLQDGKPVEVHVELTRENDIYFLARSTLTAESFTDFREKQHLRKSSHLGDFVASTLIKTLASVTANRTTFKAIFTPEAVPAKLLFRQQLEFKNIKIFELEFALLPNTDRYVKDQAQFRYNRIQRLIEAQKSKLLEFFAHVEAQQKQLGQQLRKASKFAQTVK
jgi:hypothetical protein